MLNRREFVRAACCLGAVSGLRVPIADAAEYDGKLFAFVQAGGGWDPTSFCDPKENVRGERPINNWANGAGVRQAGNIRYAPFAKNGEFFAKYYSRMLVINGVDTQTNSHTAALTHTWSGRISEGYPTTTALLAAHLGGDLTMPYLSFGGFSVTAGVTVFTRLTYSEELRNIASPATNPYSRDVRFIGRDEEVSLLRHERRRAARLASEPNLLPRDRRNREGLAHALEPGAVVGLQSFADMINELDRANQIDALAPYNSFRRRVQMAALAFRAKVAVSADLMLPGFDTHADHDSNQASAMSALTGAVDYLWELAEFHGFANRLVVVMGSDFGRTNFYNSSDGKDHWPVGSFIVMEKNQPWTNRVVGETDELHFARRIDPTALARNDSQGVVLRPTHVHKALRRYFGIENSEASRRFPFSRTEDLALFG